MEKKLSKNMGHPYGPLDIPGEGVFTLPSEGSRDPAFETLGWDWGDVCEDDPSRRHVLLPEGTRLVSGRDMGLFHIVDRCGNRCVEIRDLHPKLRSLIRPLC